jgi:hypothetical protein
MEVRRGAPIRQVAPRGLRSLRNACWRSSRGALGRWRGRYGNERAYSLARIAGEERARRARRGDSGEVELFARARRCGPWRLGRVAEVREDLAHDDWVCELCDEATRAAAMRAGEDVDGEDTSQELRPRRARRA